MGPPRAAALEPPAWRLPVAVALVSAAALAYQLLLMRWLAIAHWTPFAAMIISLALLGHGASGTWLCLYGDGARRRFGLLFPACALLFGLSAIAAPWVARAVPFNGLELVWNPDQLAWLAALYLVLAVPFFFAASCFGLAFARHGPRIPALYGADLLGAGIGALLAIALAWWPLARGLELVALCALLAAVLACAPRRRSVIVAAALSVAALVLVLPPRALAPPVNEFKSLSRALLLPGARVIAQRHGPYGWLAVLESPQVPLRHAPGLSLAHAREPPPQLGLFTDGDALAPIIRVEADADALAYLGHLTSALPYRLQRRPRVLLLGAGGGQELLQALSQGARRVDVVERDPRRLALLRGRFGAWIGHAFDDRRVRTIVAEPRAFARAGGARYDLVVLGGGATAGSAAGVQAATEQFALTVQALGEYRARLAPGGLLAITRDSKQPPRDELKLLATAIAALRAAGVRAPERELAMIRSWDASTLLLRRGPFAADELRALRRFADANGFDPVHHPGMRASEANRYNVVDRAWLHEGAQALLSSRAQAYVDAYKFAIAPATDDKPYFADFFRWRSLPELWRLRAQGGAVLLDSGYLLLLAALAQALPLALALIVLPLFALRRRGAPAVAPVRRDAVPAHARQAAPPTAARVRAWRVAAYFVGLGLAFLLVEIATLARLTLLAGHPLVAAAAGLSGFLLFAGAGSLWVQRRLPALRTDAQLARAIARAVAAIALGLLWQLAVFAAAFAHGAAWPLALRTALGLLGIAPLAFAMGLPFPLGLSRLARAAPDWVPWAWALNGFASVVAAIAAVLLGMAVGLRASLLCALALYALAAWAWRRG